jgi:hypothetical protein
MTNFGHPKTRAMTGWLLIIVTLFVALIAVSPLHGHAGLHHDGCVLCQASQNPYVEPPDTPLIGPSLTRPEPTVIEEAGQFTLLDDRTVTSRGPPQA